MGAADRERPVGTGRRKRPQREQFHTPLPTDDSAVDPKGDRGNEQARHVALVRLLASIRDRVGTGISVLDLFRGAALVVVGLNPAFRDLDHGQLAREAAELAEALAEVDSDAPPIS